jgi:hypothetical protein
LRLLFVSTAIGLSVVACQGPDAFYRPGGDEGGSLGTGGTGLVGTGGITGTGGKATGGITGTGGTPATGGITGTGGKATGGITGTGGTPATGGITGTGGKATGGITGTGGTPATGGITGTGGRATGGITGTGGTPATGGITGTGGIVSTGGVTGTGGTAGATGTGGAAGAPGTGPCAGLCSGPTAVAPTMNSGDLGTGATCQEVTGGALTSLVCGNFVSPRTFSVNGTAINCAAGGTFSLPAAKNGGYCMQASAGNQSYAYFTTF